MPHTVLKIGFSGAVKGKLPEAFITFGGKENGFCSHLWKKKKLIGGQHYDRTLSVTRYNSTTDKGQIFNPFVHSSPRPSTPPTQFTTYPTRPHLSPETNVPTFPTPWDLRTSDLGVVVANSLLFYEAQRSGQLPARRRLQWIHDSCLEDRGEEGEDLSGGWFDAGDYVKFSFPMASSVTLLVWGLLEYWESYKKIGVLEEALDSVKWPLDYLMKCHTKPGEFYVQVGDGALDHEFWGRPEDMRMPRPAFRINATRPGSDAAGEAAAAFAAASIAFRFHPDPKFPGSPFAKTLVNHAEHLFRFADAHRGKYSDSVPQSAPYYPSRSGFGDELAWAATWLFLATGNATFLRTARRYYETFDLKSKSWAFSWDDKRAGLQLLLYEITGEEVYRRSVETYLNSWLPENSATGEIVFTPKGFAYKDQWGATRYAANTAFLAALAADNGIKPKQYRGFAASQISYILGSSGRSFVIGFGPKFPLRPHHRRSSCPPPPRDCGWSDFRSPAPNPNLLVGAVVGGPDSVDHYVDVRTDYVHAEVSCDYNAGFQSAVAALYFYSAFEQKATDSRNNGETASHPQAAQIRTSSYKLQTKIMHFKV